MQEWLYSEVVKEHFTDPKNVLMENEDQWPAMDGALSEIFAVAIKCSFFCE